MDHKSCMGTNAFRRRMPVICFFFQRWYNQDMESGYYVMLNLNFSTSEIDYKVLFNNKIVDRMLWGGEGYLYSASEDTTICVWNKNGQKIQTLKGHGHWVNSIALNTDFTLRRGCFSEDNKEKNVPLNLVDEMTKSAKKIWDKIVNGQKERLVSGSDDQTLCLWNHGTASNNINY